MGGKETCKTNSEFERLKQQYMQQYECVIEDSTAP